MDKQNITFKNNMFRYHGLIALLTVIIFQASCSDPNKEAPSSNNVHSQRWTNTRILNSEGFHGVAVNSQGTSPCLICHGSDLKGSKNIPGCYTCHFGPGGSRVPDSVDWFHGQDLHAEMKAYMSVCNECHDLNRSYGTAPEACHDCHGEGAGHVLGQAWLDKKSSLFHGDTSLDDCSDCHVLNQTCFECHFGATGSRTPPGSGWNHGNNEDHRRYSSDAATCNRCHSLNRSYGNPPKTCHDCHEEEDD